MTMSLPLQPHSPPNAARLALPHVLLAIALAVALVLMSIKVGVGVGPCHSYPRHPVDAGVGGTDGGS